MSIQQLQPGERAESLRSLGAPADPGVLGRLEAARSAVRAAAAVPTSVLGVEELAEAVGSVAVLEAQAAELRLRLLAEADRRRLAQSSGASGTDAWAAALTGTTRGVMAGGIWLARLLGERYHATREAFADGAINEDQVRVIVRAGQRLPATVSGEQFRAAEAGLVVQAVGTDGRRGMDARRLRQAARRMLDTISVELAAAHEAALLEDEERRAADETWFSMGENGDGTWSGKFKIPELHGEMLRAALEKLTAPRRTPQPGSVDGFDDGAAHLGRTERMGHAFCELIEHLPTHGWDRTGTTVVVHLDYRHLLDGLGSARMDTGTRTSPGQARRLGCEAGLVPMVFDGASVPLELGREQRLHTTSQRRALSALHETCAAEGCQRPFAWCEIHHRHWWSHGGPTDLANATPLCGWHHQRAHDQRFDLTLLPTGQIRYRRRR